MSLPANLAVNAERLWETIMETAQFGATPKGGIKRLTLTDLDKQVRDWFRAACEAAGCTVTIDDMGNMFARRPGRDNLLPPIAMGSHLDTQPTGGKFDGVIGVLSGLEVIRTLNDLEIETNAPIEVINWTNEEGSRFAPAMLCSGVFAGVFSRDYADSRVDREGKKFGDELDRIGYRGTEPAGGHKLGAHFEVHIEQGPILEAEGKTIGIVTGVQGMRWFEVTVTGAESHAGSTPMPLRHDAMLAASKMIAARQRSCGKICAQRGRHRRPRRMPPEQPQRRSPARSFSRSTCATRATTSSARWSTWCGSGSTRSWRTGKSTAKVEQVWDSPAVHFNEDCIAAVARAAEAQKYPARRIVSGPGHDSAYVARVAPTSMIFVPCEGGLSHNELEKTEPEQVTAGANVLLRAVLDTDQRFAERARAG